VGGLALLPNLTERLKRELRSLAPSEYDIDIFLGDSPIDRAWMGAKSFFETQHYTKSTVDRHEWMEASKRRAYRKLLIENGGFYA
jgi:actin-related protein 6